MSRRLYSIAGLVTLMACLWPAAALAITPAQDIASTGPLTHIFLGNDLSCQVAYSGDSSYEFYAPNASPADCGTFIFTGGTLYAPDFANHSATATGGLGSRTPWTPVSQSPVSGSGTSASPYKVTTVASGGASGLTITEVDSYVAGENTYRTDVTVANSTGSPQSGILYRAGDCYLQGSDSGYGAVTAGNAPACAVNPNNSPSGRIEQWVPITGGNSFVEDGFGSVWSDIGSHTDFPNTCQCTSSLDNGGGISWDFNVPANGSVTYSHLTAFSPTGSLPLTTTKTADSSSVDTGSQDGYTITVSNPNAGAVSLTDITDTLPAGFSYVAGSTTGATTSDPSISSQNATWNGPFNISGNGSVTLHFNVTAPSTAGGPLYNNAGGDAAGGFTVTPTGPTAPVTVTSSTAALTTSKTADSSSVPAGSEDGYTITINNPNASAATLTSITDTLASGFSYGFGSTTGVTTSDPSISSQTLTWSGSFGVPAHGSVTLHFNVIAPGSAGGPFFDDAGGTASGGINVTSTGPTAPVTTTAAANTTAAACSPGQSCTTTLSTAPSNLNVTAGPGSGGILTENVDVGTPLECSKYKARDPNWFSFFETATDRTKTLVYTLKGAGRDADDVQFCFGAPYPFKTRDGHHTADQHTLPDGSIEFVGLLPLCRHISNQPCISSRKSTKTKPSDVVITVQIPAGLPGDPRGRV